MRPSRQLTLTFLALVFASNQARAEEQTLFDFEQGGLSAAWKALGKTEAARKPVVQPPEGAGVRPAGSALEISCTGMSAVHTLSGKVPRDWRRFAEFWCWIYRSPEEVQRAPKLTIEVQLWEEDNQARFWRRIELAQAGWQRVTVPLKFFRQGEGRIARWDRIDRLQFLIRDEARLQIDALGVTTGDGPQASQLSEKDLRELAFPGIDAPSIRTASPGGMLVLTNSKDLDLEKLTAHLSKGVAAVREDFPFLDLASARPVLIVFATREEYQAFTPRLAERLGAQAAVPKSTGYTLHGIATSFWDPTYGTLRPVYLHEFIHALMEGTALLPNRSEWLHEGLASRYQARFHPQDGFDAFVLKSVEDANRRQPMETLLNGKPIALDHYWQALTVTEFLLSDERYRKLWPELFADFQKRGSTDMAPVLGKRIEASPEEFARQWAEFCREKYKAK